MDDLAKKLNVKSKEQWYHVTAKEMQQQGATSLLNQYNNSPSKLLQSVYPEYLVALVVFIESDILGISPNFIIMEVERDIRVDIGTK